MEKPWKPYEDNRLPFERVRYMLLPPLLTKRFFFLPSLNLVGLSILELLVAVGLLAGTVALGYLQRSADAEQSGNVAQFFWFPLFIMIMYRSPIALLFGVSFERSMFWHSFFAMLALGYGVWHGVSCMYWASFDDDGGQPVRGFQAFVRGEHRGEFVSGAVLVILMMVTIMSSIHPIRRFLRRIWLWSHHILAIAAVVFCAIHGAGAVVFAFCFYIADRVFGYVYQARWKYSRISSEAKATLLHSGLVMLSFPRTFSFIPGQYMCVNIPSISLVEYHTFSIASCPSDDKLCLLVKPDGYWTRKLFKRVQNLSAQNNEQVPIRAYVHGPAGSVALDWQARTKYQTFILVAGGVGVTPLISFYRHLLTQALRGRPIRQVILIWAVRNRAIATDMIWTQLDAQGEARHRWGEINGDSENPRECSRLGFSTEVYVTRPDDPQHDAQQNAQSRTLSETDMENVLVKVYWNNGRPNLRNSFAAVGEAMEQRGRIGVLGCGPGALTREVVRAARNSTKHGLHFDVHLEHFY